MDVVIVMLLSLAKDVRSLWSAQRDAVNVVFAFVVNASAKWATAGKHVKLPRQIKGAQKIAQCMAIAMLASAFATPTTRVTTARVMFHPNAQKETLTSTMLCAVIVDCARLVVNVSVTQVTTGMIAAKRISAPKIVT